MGKSSIKQLLNFNNLFTNRCAKGQDGYLNGPGIICSIYLFLVVIGIILNIGWNIYSLIEDDSVTKVKLLLYTVIMFVWGVFVYYFMYSACYMCSGFRGFMVVLVLGLILNYIISKLFKDVIRSQMNMMMEETR